MTGFRYEMKRRNDASSMVYYPTAAYSPPPPPPHYVQQQEQEQNHHRQHSSSWVIPPPPPPPPPQRTVRSCPSAFMLVSDPRDVMIMKPTYIHDSHQGNAYNVFPNHHYGNTSHSSHVLYNDERRPQCLPLPPPPHHHHQQHHPFSTQNQRIPSTPLHHQQQPRQEMMMTTSTMHMNSMKREREQQQQHYHYQRRLHQRELQQRQQQQQHRHHQKHHAEHQEQQQQLQQQEQQQPQQPLQQQLPQQKQLQQSQPQQQPPQQQQKEQKQHKKQEEIFSAAHALLSLAPKLSPDTEQDNVESTEDHPQEDDANYEVREQVNESRRSSMSTNATPYLRDEPVIFDNRKMEWPHQWKHQEPGVSRTVSNDEIVPAIVHAYSDGSWTGDNNKSGSSTSLDEISMSDSDSTSSELIRANANSTLHTTRRMNISSSPSFRPKYLPDNMYCTPCTPLQESNERELKPSTVPSAVQAKIETTTAVTPSEDNENFHGLVNYTGSLSLALDDDEDFLSPLHCFLRRYCVEVFTATPNDLPSGGSSSSSSPARSSSKKQQQQNGITWARHHGRVGVGQVGLRCIHCKHRPLKLREERAVCFPSSLKNIYHSIETWQRRHSLVCRDIPTWIKADLTRLMSQSKSGAGGRRQYWEESAKHLGMGDTQFGIRFIREPGDRGEDASLPNVSAYNSSPLSTGSNNNITTGLIQDHGRPVVTKEDSKLVTDYLFLLMDQMETCRFTEQDRSGGRSKVKDCPNGYAGMQCKHCNGKAGFGRYFPASVQALTSANSDRNIYNHLGKCRRCPEEIRTKLAGLLHEQEQRIVAGSKSKNRRGSRKLFFERVWKRLHTNEDPKSMMMMTTTTKKTEPQQL